MANAVLDGADALMLSGETSVGKYPIVTVQTMARIIQTTEAGDIAVPRLQHDPRTRGGAITRRRRTSPGPSTPAPWSRSPRPATPCAGCPGCTASCRCSRSRPDESVRNQLTLSWGVETFLVDYVEHTDDDVPPGRPRDCSGLGRGRPGDLVVVVAGSPPGTPGSTNTLRIHQLGSLS